MFDLDQLRSLTSQLNLALGGRCKSAPLADLVRAWIDDHVATRRSPNTRRLYTRHANRLIEWLGTEPCAEVGPKHALLLGERLRHAPDEAGQTIETLRRVLAWGRDSAWISGPDPLRNLPRYRTQTRERVLSEQESNALWLELTSLHGGRYSVPAATCRLVLLTGIRIGEVRVAKREHLSLAGQSLRLPAAKGRPRTALLPRPACELLRDLPRWSETWIFPGRRGAISQQQCHRAWALACSQAGVEGAVLHACRHTVITDALELGADLATVQRLAGHLSPETTLRYAHARRDRVLDIADRVAARIRGAS